MQSLFLRQLVFQKRDLGAGQKPVANGKKDGEWLIFFEKLENMGLEFNIEEAFGMRDTNEFDSDFSEGFA